MNRVCVVCLNSDTEVLEACRLVGKECFCLFTCHQACWFAALAAMKGRRFCLLCDRDNYERCGEARTQKNILVSFFWIFVIYCCVWYIILWLKGR